MNLKKSTTKILLAHSSNDLYGASKILINIIEILISEGYKVYLLIPEKGPLHKNNVIKKCNIKTIKFGVFRKRYFNFFGIINRLYFILRSTFIIRSFIIKNKIDLVYTNTSTLISPTIASYLNRTPSISHVHEIPSSSFYYSKFISFIMNNFSSKVIVVSKSVMDYWVKIGLKKNKIELIYNGFKFQFSSCEKTVTNKIVFTSISRIIPYKGHEFQINLFRKLIKIRKDVYLQIIGDTLPFYKNYKKRLENLVNKYELQENITFLGFRKDIKSILNKTDFFIHSPVNPDPLPTVIFEAFQSGVPVICSNQGGCVEILNHGKNGLLIDCNKLEFSSNKVLSYIDQKETHKTQLKNAKDFLELNFNYNIFENKILSLIKELI